MSQLRFVHSADLHLDSPFAGVGATVPDHIRTKLLDATFEAYESLIDLCLRERAEALLVAGDVYDSADGSLRAQLKFAAGLERLHAAGIRSFVCHGNHDPLDRWDARLSVPSSVHRFGPDVEAVPFEPAAPERGMVYGVSYPRQRVVENLTPRFARRDSSQFAVGLLHANVGGNTAHQAYAPCGIGDLAGTGMDYWALGHVHTRQVLRDLRPAIVYPGNLQGRHAKEVGPRGAFLVDVRGHDDFNLQFRELDAVRWEWLKVDVTGLAGLGELIEALHRGVGAALDAADRRPLAYRIELYGRGPLHAELNRKGVLEDLAAQLNDEWSGQRPFAWCEELSSRVKPAFNREQARAAGDFLSEVIGLVDDLKGDAAALTPLRAELANLYSSDRARRYLKDLLPGEEELRALLDDAETECVDRLVGDVL